MKRACGIALAAAAALMLLASGCDTLPDGDPPQGDLTDNTQPPVTSALALKNHLATELIVYALQNDVKWLDPGSDPEVIAIAADASGTAGFRLVRGAPLRLGSGRDSDGMTYLTVSDADGKELWRSKRP